jgi:hypothetical protein
MEKDTRSPGLSFRDGRPQWRASKAAVKAGYTPKTVNLSSHADSPDLLRERCIRLQREMLDWLSRGERKHGPRFDGTFASLFDVYQSDPESSYFGLKPASRHPYDCYLEMLRAEIGRCHIDRTDGTDLKRWFRFWSTPEPPNVKPTIARARMAIAVIKAAVTFGMLKRLRGCPEFRTILSATTFQGLKAREQVLDAAQVVAARKAAHKLGEPRMALCYAIQFEGMLRQWDVRGQWIPLNEPQPSAILRQGKKWIGPTWANVDANLVLRWTPTKTEGTTGAAIAIDFKECPMVMEELKRVPAHSDRQGPLIVNLRTGLPYSDRQFARVWAAVRQAAGIPSDVWNRDLRASGVTEAREAAAPIDDVKKQVGHSSNSRTTAKVYDRAKLAAHRRIAAARKATRENS